MYNITSCDGESGKLVLGDREACVVVGSDLEVVPRGGVQVQHDKVAPRLDAVGHQGPVQVVPRLVLDHEVEDGAAAVHPGVEVEGHAAGRHLQEGLGLGDGGLHPLGLGRQLLARFSDADAGIIRGDIKMREIGSAVMVLTFAR